MFFLATPHQVVDMHRLVHVYFPTSKPYCPEFEAKLGPIQTANVEFGQVANRISIHSFYETIPTKIGVSTNVVVKRSSAILGKLNLVMCFVSVIRVSHASGMFP